MRILDAAVAQLKSGDTLDSQTLFTLYDTYGFPVALTADICREREVQVDFAGFDEAKQQQRERARAAGRLQAAQGLSYDGVQIGSAAGRGMYGGWAAGAEADNG